LADTADRLPVVELRERVGGKGDIALATARGDDAGRPVVLADRLNAPGEGGVQHSRRDVKGRSLGIAGSEVDDLAGEKRADPGDGADERPPRRAVGVLLEDRRHLRDGDALRWGLVLRGRRDVGAARQDFPVAVDARRY